MFTANCQSLTSVYTGEGRVLCCVLQLPGGRGKVQVIMMMLIIRSVVTRVIVVTALASSPSHHHCQFRYTLHTPRHYNDVEIFSNYGNYVNAKDERILAPNSPRGEAGRRASHVTCHQPHIITSPHHHSSSLVVAVTHVPGPRDHGVPGPGSSGQVKL